MITYHDSYVTVNMHKIEIKQLKLIHVDKILLVMLVPLCSVVCNKVCILPSKDVLTLFPFSFLFHPSRRERFRT